MAAPTRITRPLLDVLEVFLNAWQDGGRDVYGWTIMKETKRAGPTVYGVLDRLENLEWVTGSWEPEAEPGRPRRRLYQLTPNGRVEAVQLLAERRPAHPGVRAALAQLGLSRRALAWLRPLTHGGESR